MTTPVEGDTTSRDWWARPRVVLSVVGTLVLLVALLTPESDAGRIGDSRLSSNLAGSMNARGLADVAGRFGWRVLRNNDPEPSTTERGTTVHAVLAPPMPLTAGEAHEYLEAVRAGDALLMVAEPRSALSDSLGIKPTRAGGTLVHDPQASAGCTSSGFAPALWPDGEVHLFGLTHREMHAGSERFAAVTMRAGGERTAEMDAAEGFPYGRGRVVVVSDPDLLRNDVIRHCPWGADVIAVRMLEWLRAGGGQPRTTLAFDEYHQGFGSHSSTTRAIRRFLVHHPVGRTILTGLIAALVLLIALAPRPLPPRPRERVERRDPLEQAEALALAYEQVSATRTAIARLVRGLRYRVERSVPLGRSRSDDAFLDDVLAAAPDLAADVALVRSALREAGRNEDLSAVGEALRRIEAILTTPSVA